jgi:hypothetical protein
MVTEAIIQGQPAECANVAPEPAPTAQAPDDAGGAVVVEVVLEVGACAAVVVLLEVGLAEGMACAAVVVCVPGVAGANVAVPGAVVPTGSVGLDAAGSGSGKVAQPARSNVATRAQGRERTTTGENPRPLL